MSEQAQNRLKQVLLDHYHCTFFLPIFFNKNHDDHGKQTFRLKPVIPSYRYSTEATGADAQAFYFFTPTLRKILFEQVDKTGQPLQTTLKPIREWRLEGERLKGWELHLDQPLDDTKPASALTQQVTTLQSLRLYRYFNGLYLLSFRVQPKALTPALQKVLADHNKAQYLDDLPEPLRKQAEPMQLEAWLRFTRLARVLYPSFMEQGEEFKIAPLTLHRPGMEAIRANNAEINLRIVEQMGENLSPIVQELFLQFFSPKDSERIRNYLRRHIQLYDDRMFVSVAYGLAGEKHNEATLQRINALVGTTDRVADTFADCEDYPYSPAALADYLSGKQFTLWQDLGGTYSFTDMVNAYVYRGYVFREIIAPKNIPRIYDRMMIQALFYQASLRYYDQEITRKTQTLIDEQADPRSVAAIREQREEFIRFTNQYWFREITNQMQGKEIFRLQQQGLGVEEQYQQLQDEIERTNEYLQVLHEERLANEANQSSKRANKLADAAIVVGLIALLPVINDFFKTEEKSLWSLLAQPLGEPQWYKSLAVLVFVMVIIAILLKLLRPQMRKWLGTED